MSVNGTIVPSLDIIGLVYSIVGLASVVPTVFFFKQYSRFLDYIPVSYTHLTLPTTPYV